MSFDLNLNALLFIAAFVTTVLYGMGKCPAFVPILLIIVLIGILIL